MAQRLVISAVIPTWNRAGLLRRALDSILEQTRLPDEILVVDDGSTDGTLKKVRESLPRVRYFRQDHAGVSAARNLAVSKARGNWIAFLDSDDAWLPRKLEKQEAALQNDSCRLCHTDEIWIRDGRRVNPRKKHAKKGGFIFQHCLPLCAISPSSVLMRRELLERWGGFDESLPAGEDYDLWLKITATEPVLYLDEPLLTKYGGHEDQLSRTVWGLDRFRIQSLENVIQRVELAPEDKKAAQAMLIEKATIMAQGARKRGRAQEAESYEHLVQRYGGEGEIHDLG